MAKKAEKLSLKFRMEEHYVEQIDAYAKELGMTRSAYLRMLIKQSMGEPAIEAAMQEAWFTVQPMLGLLLRKLLGRVSAELPEMIDETMAEERRRRQAGG